MAVSLPDLVGRIRLDTSELDGVGDKASKALSGIGKAAVVAGAAAAAGLGAFAAVGVKGAADVEAGLREVVTLLGETGGVANSSLAGFQKQTADLSNELGIAQDTLVKGLYQSISAGVPRENAFTFLEVASKASVAGVTDVATAVDGISTVVNAFGLDASDAQAASDSLFTAVKGGKTTFGELASSIANVAPAAAASKVSFQEVNAAIATLTAGGTSTAEATTQLKAALAGLQRPSKDLDAIFQALGFTNAQAAIESKGLGFALDAVRDASGGSQGKLATLLGSTEAVAAANVLAGTGAAKFKEQMDAQAAAAGSTQQAFDVMGESVNRQMETAKVRFQNAAIALGTLLLPAVTVIAGALADFAGVLATNLVPVLKDAAARVQAFGAFLGRNETPVKVVAGLISSVLIPAFVLMGISATVSAAKVVAAWVAKQAAAIKATIIHGAQVVKTVAGWVLMGAQATLHAAKVVASWLLTSAGAVAAGVVMAAQVALQVAKWVALQVAAAANAAKVVASWLVTSAGAVAAGVVMVAQSALMVARWVFMGTQALAQAARIAAAWLIAMGPIGLVVAAVIALVVVVVKNFDTIKAKISAAWEFVKEKTSAAWTALKTAVSTGIGAAVTLVATLPGKVLSALGDFGSLLVNAGRELMSGLARGIGEKIASVVNKVKEAAQKIKDLLPGSPVKDGPLTAWNRGAAGVRLMDMLAGGIERGTGGVRDALAAAVVPPDIPALGRGAVRAAQAGGLGTGAGGLTLHSQVTVEGNVSSDVDLHRILDERDADLVRTLRAVGV